MHDQHPYHPGTEPLAVGALHVTDGHISVEFVSEQPTYRHIDMTFRAGENEAMDQCLEQFAEIAIAAAMQSMLEIVGTTTVPDDPSALVPNWQCRICDRVAPPLTPGWIEVSLDEGPLRRFCPVHIGYA